MNSCFVRCADAEGGSGAGNNLRESVSPPRSTHGKTEAQKDEVVIPSHMAD